MKASRPEPQSESGLIRRAPPGARRGGSPSCWARTGPGCGRIVAQAVSIGGSAAGSDPSDVIQEAYLAAAAGFAEFAERSEISFFVWLRWLAAMKLNAIHRNHLGCQARDAGREVSIDRAAAPRASSAALADSVKLVGRLTSACAAAIREERKARLRAALDAMDRLDREILSLRHFEELTNAEAAEALGLQESAASKRYVRALRTLKEALGPSAGETGGLRP